MDIFVITGLALVNHYDYVKTKITRSHQTCIFLAVFLWLKFYWQLFLRSFQRMVSVFAQVQTDKKVTRYRYPPTFLVEISGH